MTIFARNLGFPEAPVLLQDGNLLCTEMTPETGWVIWFSADGKSRRVVAKTGRPNGMAQDSQGAVWVAESVQRQLLKLSLDGNYEVFAKAGEHRPFLFLNDLAFAPNGDLYLTDSGITVSEFSPGSVLNPDWAQLHYDGRVYRVDVNTGEVETIDSGLRFTNGIAFGPDQNLYVAETLTGMIHRYEWMEGRIVGGRTAFGSAIDPQGPQGLHGPDGMKFGADGKLYIAVFGQGMVTVLDADGSVARRIRTEGLCCTNLAFGRKGEHSIYVTEAETGTIQKFDVGTDGLPLFG